MEFEVELRADARAKAGFRVWAVTADADPAGPSGGPGRRRRGRGAGPCDGVPPGVSGGPDVAEPGTGDGSGRAAAARTRGRPAPHARP
ncbi:hypothetical protein [Streptomyces sp. NPDC058855]|uniref:hypothetical protein n=1 Tax=Streptomyces sp. NPDC058855 TaxID=3346651 RepID=UPI00369F6D0B